MQEIPTILRRFPALQSGVPLYQALLASVTIVEAIVFAFVGPGIGDAWAAIGLAVVAALAERGRVRLGEGIEASISLIPTVFAAAAFGPLAAMLIATASFL